MNNRTHTLSMLKAVEASNGEIICTVLEECLAEERLEKEQMYVDKLQPDINAMQDVFNPIQFKEFVIVGEENCSSIYSNEVYKSILFMLLATKDLKRISETLNVSFNVVADLSSGKTSHGLENLYPEEYNKVIMTCGSRLSYNEFKYVLELLSSGLYTDKYISQQVNLDYTQIGLIKRKKRDYMVRLYENDSSIKALYDKIKVIKRSSKWAI